MALQLVIAPSPDADWTEVDPDSVGLTRKVQGRVFRKHILNYGELLHPVTGQKIQIDSEFVGHLKTNFANHVGDIVQVPLANHKNEHVENPDANQGEVVGIEDDPKSGKVYALVDARLNAERFGKTYLGASAFMNLNYKDTKTNKRVGPTLLHVAVTNRPYVTGLDPYEEIVAASASEDEGQPALMQMSAASHREASVPRTKEEILAELKADHEIDVEALQGELATALTQIAEHESAPKEETPDAAAQLAAQIQQAMAGTGVETKLSAEDGEVSTEDIVGAVAQLAKQNVTLSSTQEASATRIAALERRNVETEVDALVGQGRILPAKRDTHVELALSNREVFDALLPEEPIVKLGNEKGTSPDPEHLGNKELDVDAELARLTAPGGAAAEYIN